MRCTAPMNAPGPPPTMPRRTRRLWPSLEDSIGMSCSLSADTQHFAVRFHVSARLGKIVERAFGSLNDVLRNERRAFLCALLAILDAALPFEYRPTRIVVLRELGKYCAEVDLPVAQRSESPGTLDPGLIAAINPLASAWTELRVLYVKHFDPLVIDV